MRIKNNGKIKRIVLIDGKCRHSDLDKIRIYYTIIVNVLLVVGRNKQEKNTVLVLISA